MTTIGTTHKCRKCGVEQDLIFFVNSHGEVDRRCVCLSCKIGNNHRWTNKKHCENSLKKRDEDFLSGKTKQCPKCSKYVKKDKFQKNGICNACLGMTLQLKTIEAKEMIKQERMKTSSKKADEALSMEQMIASFLKSKEASA